MNEFKQISKPKKKSQINKNRIAAYNLNIKSKTATNSKKYLFMYEIPLSFDHRGSLV